MTTIRFAIICIWLGVITGAVGFIIDWCRNEFKESVEKSVERGIRSALIGERYRNENTERENRVWLLERFANMTKAQTETLVSALGENHTKGDIIRINNKLYKISRITENFDTVAENTATIELAGTGNVKDYI